MLCQLGVVSFEVAPFGMHEYDFDGAARFAEHPVLGKRPTLEFVGEGGESWTISGRIMPHLFGGLDQLASMQAMRRSGRPQPWMRGDGYYMGWVVIDHIAENSTFLDTGGVGKWIEFEISLKRTDAPGASGIFSTLVSLFI
jgi:phage protein U